MENWRGGLEGIVLESVEHGREVTLAGIGQQHYNLLTFVLGTLGHLDGCEEGSTGRDTYEQTFALGNLTTCTDGIVVLYIEHLVDHIGIRGLGHEAGTDTLNLMRTALTTIEHGA